MQITLIIGLPASGKTTYAKTLGGFLVDDPQSVTELPLHCEHLVITDPNFCIEYNLNSAITILRKKYGESVVIDRIYFENDPIQCYKNAVKRLDKPVTASIKALSLLYTPDKNFCILPCYGK